MRQEFDSTVSREEQLMRTAKAKRPGRKHLHQASSRVAQRRKNAPRNRAKLQAAKSKAFHALVRAYWAGDRDTNPAAK